MKKSMLLTAFVFLSILFAAEISIHSAKCYTPPNKIRLYINNDFLVYVSKYYFEAKMGDPEYGVDLDLNKDGIINLFDIATIASHMNNWMTFKEKMSLYMNIDFLNYYCFYYDAKKGDSNYTPAFDLIKDDIIDIMDAIVIINTINAPNKWYVFSSTG